LINITDFLELSQKKEEEEEKEHETALQRTD